MFRLALLLALFIPGAGSYAREKVYIHSLDGVSRNLDPTQLESYYSALIAGEIYDSLYIYKSLKIPRELRPSLALAMPDISPDGLTWTIRIRRGVYYADDPAFPGGKGREVVAGDFVYGLLRHFDPKNRSVNRTAFEGIVGLQEWRKSLDYGATVPGLQAPDAYTIRIRLKERNPRFIYDLASVTAVFVPREAVEKYGREFSQRPVGSGPFRLEKLDTTRAVLVRNPRYRKEIFNLKEEGYDPARHDALGVADLNGKPIPMVDRVEIRFLPQVVSRWNSFVKGSEIQYARVPGEMAKDILASMDPPRLKKTYADRFILKPEMETGLVYSTFNMSDERFGHNKDPGRDRRNRALRCAIKKAFDWKARIKRFYYGFGEAYPGSVPPGLPGFHRFPDSWIAKDIPGAKKLLAEAGWNKDNLPVLTYGAAGGVRSRQMFEQFRGWIRRIGYPRHKIKLRIAPTFGDYIKDINEGRYTVFGLGWVPSMPDPLQLMERYYGGSLAPGSNKAFFQNSEFDELYREVSLLENGAKRFGLLQKMNRIVMEECVAMEAFSRKRLHVWHRNVKMDYSTNLRRRLFRYISVGDPTAH